MMAADVGKKGAGILRVKPKIKWDKDRARSRCATKNEFPWFWGWDGKTQDFGGGLELRWKSLERPALFAGVQACRSAQKGWHERASRESA